MESFYSISQVKNEVIEISNHTLATIRIRLDKRQALYYRQVDSVFSLLENIGGFKESVYAIMFIFACFWQTRLFKGSFYKKLYQIHKSAPNKNH